VKKRQKVRRGIILVSFFLFPATFYYFSPVLIIEASSKGIINGSFIMFLLLLVSAIFLGRAFCGWACPAAGCQEAIFNARSKTVTKGNLIKWFIWFPWIFTIAFYAIKAGGYKHINFLFQTTYGFSIGNLQGLITYFIVLFILIVLPAFLVGKRAFCHQLCWMSPFMIIGRKIRNNFNWPSLKLIADPTSCKECHTCTYNCPMSLQVEDMVKNQKMENSECILCGTCVDGCKQNVIRYEWGKIQPVTQPDRPT